MCVPTQNANDEASFNKSSRNVKLNRVFKYIHASNMMQ